MVDSVTNKYELIVVPRKKKKDFVELILSFFLVRNEILLK